MASNYIRDTLKTVDYDRYFISLFFAQELREALWALFLFHHEIAKTRFVVTETQLGLIRLQWWREEIDKLYKGGDAPDNPVLVALDNLIREYALPQALFENLIYAHEFDLEGVSPTGMQGVESYADLTTTPLNKLALHIIGEKPEQEAVQLISIQYTLLKLYMRRSMYASHDFVLIPVELSGDVQKYLIEQDLNSDGSVYLRAHKALCDIYLKKLRQHNFDTSKEVAENATKFKGLRVWLNVMFKRR